MRCVKELEEVEWFHGPRSRVGVAGVRWQLHGGVGLGCGYFRSEVSTDEYGEGSE